MNNNNLSVECASCVKYLYSVGLCTAEQTYTFKTDKCPGFKRRLNVYVVKSKDVQTC